MKRRIGILAGILMIFMASNIIYACDIDFEIQGETKANYAVGDIIVMKVQVTFTHRVCPEGIQATKFGQNGIQILKATKWVETSPGVWERKLQTKITSADNGIAKLNAKRTCEKEGGYGEITLKIG